MKKQATKIPIYFDELRYNENVNNYETKISLEAKIDIEANKLLKTDGIVIKEKTDAENEFYKIIENVNFERNPMQLQGKKLVELHGLEIAPLIELQKKYLKFYKANEPQTETYTIYAETPEELAKYNAYINVIKAIEDFTPYLCKITGAFQYFAFEKAFSFLLKWDTKNQKFIINHQFIKAN